MACVVCCVCVPACVIKRERGLVEERKGMIVSVV